MNISNNVIVKEVQTEAVFLYAQQMLSDYPALQQNAKFKDFLESATRNLVLQITTWCQAGKIPTRIESETVRWPDGVWQTFKAKFMPHWFTRRFPVRMEEKVFERAIHTYFVCPHLAARSPYDHIKFMATGSRESVEMR